MTKTMRAITPSAFADRLGLSRLTFDRLPHSPVMDACAKFYDGNGDLIGTITYALCPIEGTWDAQFHIAADTAEPDEAHSTLWL